MMVMVENRRLPLNFAVSGGIDMAIPASERFGFDVLSGIAAMALQTSCVIGLSENLEVERVCSGAEFVCPVTFFVGHMANPAALFSQRLRVPFVVEHNRGAPQLLKNFLFCQYNKRMIEVWQ